MANVPGSHGQADGPTAGAEVDHDSVGVVQRPTGWTRPAMLDSPRLAGVAMAATTLRMPLRLPTPLGLPTNVAVDEGHVDERDVVTSSSPTVHVDEDALGPPGDRVDRPRPEATQPGGRAGATWRPTPAGRRCWSRSTPRPAAPPASRRRRRGSCRRRRARRPCAPPFHILARRRRRCRRDSRTAARRPACGGHAVRRVGRTSAP